MHFLGVVGYWEQRICHCLVAHESLQDGGYITVMQTMLGDILSLPSELPVWAGFSFLSWSGACIICSRSSKECWVGRLTGSGGEPPIPVFRCDLFVFLRVISDYRQVFSA